MRYDSSFPPCSTLTRGGHSHFGSLVGFHLLAYLKGAVAVGGSLRPSRVVSQ